MVRIYDIAKGKTREFAAHSTFEPHGADYSAGDGDIMPSDRTVMKKIQKSGIIVFGLRRATRSKRGNGHLALAR
ncbi:hypothetical protein RKLH11_563 [Rhodobacteraceae bacterium KLH11]|nr:hypothetical protein RKLH11_563 [Rhodobacteraceae bacterium KLH11]